VLQCHTMVSTWFFTQFSYIVHSKRYVWPRSQRGIIKSVRQDKLFVRKKTYKGKLLYLRMKPYGYENQYRYNDKVCIIKYIVMNQFLYLPIVINEDEFVCLIIGNMKTNVHVWIACGVNIKSCSHIMWKKTF
jgi:hypothetical protein